MSTCRGALAPHHDCPHGDACDWDGGPRLPVVERRGLTVFIDGEPGPMLNTPLLTQECLANRADRRAARRRTGR